ncbi:uncharacterized protein [Cherax quadricarinatus]|uniref:uncharacterized protein n=1 Tax=Cherax quadricarinatus TaxID=27406 RepID=UPI00387EC3D4
MGPRLLEWEGSKPLLPILDTNFAVHLLEVMAKYGDSVAVVNSETQEQRKYSELCDLVPRVSAGLHGAGVTLGHPVLYLAPNYVDYPLVFLSVIYHGAIFVPLNPNLSTDDLVNGLKVSDICWAVVHYTVADKLETAVSRLPSGTIRKVWVLGDAAGRPSFNDLMDFQPLPPVTKTEGLEPGRVVAINFLSSGTTGLSKAVMCTHRNLLASMTIDRCQWNEYVPDTISQMFKATLLVIPMFHIFGYIHVVATLTHGGTVITLRKFSPKSFLESIQKFKVTMAPLVPYLIEFMGNTPLLRQYDLSSLRVITTGGSRLSPSVQGPLQAQLNVDVYNCYGMTEATSCVTQCLTTASFKEGCVGKVLPYFQLKVVDVESGEMCEPGQVGELHYRGPSIMLGYANNAAATADILDAEGWLHSGDIGYFDQDNFIFIADRIKEIIKVKGYQVSPSELEKLLSTHEDVSEAAVVGVPDQQLGMAPRAFVVAKPGASIDPSRLQQFVASQVSSYKQLAGGICIVDAIPKSPSGKILKRLLMKGLKPPAAKL